MCHYRPPSRIPDARVVLLASALLGLATPAPASRTVPAPQLECEADSAVLHVIRERHWQGAGWTSLVFIDRQLLGVLDNGTCFAACVVPGRHLLRTGVHGAGKSVDVVAGRSYYFLFEFATGLSLLEAAEGSALVAQSRHVAATRREQERAERMLRKRYRQPPSE